MYKAIFEFVGLNIQELVFVYITIVCLTMALSQVLFLLFRYSVTGNTAVLRPQPHGHRYQYGDFLTTALFV